MKTSALLAAAAATFLLALPAPAPAEGPKLSLPDFSHLRAKANDSVDITIGRMLLHFASKFARDDGDEDAEAMRILSDIDSVRVRNFSFDNEGEYSRADVDAVRAQLRGPGWTSLVQSHKREPAEDVDVYVNMEGDKILGLAVIACEPREFTIVNIVGNIDVDKFAKLQGQFGIPKVDVD